MVESINKSLDELVSEDHQMRNKRSGSNSNTTNQNTNSHQHGNGGGNNYHQRGGGGRHQDSRGGHRGGGNFNRYSHHSDRRRGGGSFDNNDNESEGSRPRHHTMRGGRGRGRGGRGGHHHGGRHQQSHSPASFINENNNGEQVDAYGNNVEGRRVFVSNLAFETQWKYLKDHMRQAGDVMRADIFENKDGTSRGIGLVEFKTKICAQNALNDLHESTLDGRKLYLKKDTQGHVFPPLKSKKDMMDSQDSFGGNRGGGRDFRGGRQMTQQHRYNDRRMSRSRSRSNSADEQQQRRPQRGGAFRGGAAEGMTGGRQRNHQNNANPENQIVDSNGSPLLANQTSMQSQNPPPLKITRRQPEESSATQTFSIHISNLPFSVDKVQLRDAFNEFGVVLHASVSIDERGQSRGIGIVEYDTRDAAEEASIAMNKAMFNGREVSVNFNE